MQRKNKKLNHLEPFLLRANEAAYLCGVSRTQWLSLVNLGKAPPATVNLGAGKKNKAPRWRLDIIHEWCSLNCPQMKQFDDVLSRYSAQYIKLRRLSKHKQIKILSDGYIKTLLCMGTNLCAADIPQGLIELKRAEMELKREIIKDKK